MIEQDRVKKNLKKYFSWIRGKIFRPNLKMITSACNINHVHYTLYPAFYWNRRIVSYRIV